jgi:serine/threonine protein kinase
MTLEVCCPNPACQWPSRLVDDALGRTFRCLRCGTKLPRRAECRDASSSFGSTFDGSFGDRGKLGAASERSLGAVLPSRLGRFQVRALLGAGSCATVYRAFDPDLEREVALKVPHDATVAGSKAMARFLGEARALARLRHPSIVPVYEAGRSGRVPFLATAYVEGRTLGQVLEDGPLESVRAAEIAAGLADALGYAHDLGVVHRDVKPANILVAPDGAVHLTDFGLAHRLDTETPARTGVLIGTPAYVAPEQAEDQGESPLPVSDQYSLGVVLYEMLCGRAPFLGPPALVLYMARHDDPPTPRSLRPGLPRSLETICLKAMARDPSDRYPCCRALAADLRQWLTTGRTGSTRPRPPVAIDRAIRWLGQRPDMAVSTALALIGVATSTALATALLGSASPVPASPDVSAATHATRPWIASSPAHGPR